METKEAAATPALDALVEAAVRRSVAPLFDELRGFVDRRLAEVSTEVNAAVQMVDFSETAISKKLAGIQDQIARLLAAPAAEARNSGLELESVVTTTESAAHRILDAAEAINRCVGMSGGADEMIRDKLSTIFSECEFQDLAGQRIRRAIQHLRMVEGAIGLLANGGALEIPVFAPSAIAAGPDLAQSDVDTLFAKA